MFLGLQKASILKGFSGSVMNLFKPVIFSK